jgi:hypothetical protein
MVSSGATEGCEVMSSGYWQEGKGNKVLAVKRVKLADGVWCCRARVCLDRV